jgi:hypothetical protein
VNRFRVSLLAILLASCSPLPTDDASVKERVIEKVREINKAVIAEDFAKVADLTHPALIKLLGGREKMIASMQAGAKEMRAKGFVLRSATIDNPSDLVAAGAERYVIVPFKLEIKTPKGKLLQKSFVIGVSDDGGKTWLFVNGGVDIKKIKEVLPNLPDALRIPDPEDPVFEKESSK